MKAEFGSSIPRLKRLLPGFRKVRVAVLGDLMLDRYLWGTAHRLSAEAPVPIVDFEEQRDFLGGAGNVASNLAALGAQVRLFGFVGGRSISKMKFSDDEAGAALRARLKREKIDDRGVLSDPQRITTVKTRVIAGHRQIVRVDYERRNALSRDSEERLFRLLVGSLRNVDALLLSDYDKGLIADEFAERVLHACDKFEVPVFVKPKASRLLPYRGARAVVCNRVESETYVRQSLNDDEAVVEAGRALLAQFGCAAVVITRGGRGMSVFEEASPRHLHIAATSSDVTLRAHRPDSIERGGTGRQVFDVTGAGDTVLSALSLAIAAGATMMDAAFLANTAAGVVVGKLGTATVSPAELAAALDEAQS